MKTIVTHFAPDVDAVTSVWLIKSFLPGWEEAEVKFVPAGKTLDNSIVDSDPDILHVDTGWGKLDHHQTDEDTCAAKRTLEFVSRNQKSLPRRQAGKIKNQKLAGKINKFPDEALERLVDVVNDIDHFREVYFPNPNADFYDFSLISMIDGWKLLYPEDHLKVAMSGTNALEGIYKSFQNKVWAEEEIRKEGVEFTTRWGKAMGFETVNDDTVRIAQKIGYVLAVRKDPHKDYVRIKALPGSTIDLTRCYNSLRKKDPDATWYLHASRKMVLNGSMKNPETKATKLTLREIIDILKK